MGVRPFGRQDATSSESLKLTVDDLPTLAAPGLVSTSKVPEKQALLRRKLTEKTVLDDIMGDPDDFRDLGDSDAESDGGRWEDNMTNEGQDVTSENEVLQRGNLELEDALYKTLEIPISKGNSQSSVPKLKLEASSLQNEGVVDQTHSKSQHCVSEKESICMQNGRTSKSPSHKVHQKRFFIIKSLNHQNIEKSIEKGIWATQALNEPVLNEAFESAEKVVLIFSVNMSGHFQGYARMVSPIGRRRANVWSEANSGENPWGGTFRVEWIRMYELPFQKTVHLKNPLNNFKPVKISRDCQEVTKDIGEALCALIDEGADREGKAKRKIGPGEDFFSKKVHMGRPSLSNGVFYRPPLKGLVTPLVHPAVPFSPQTALGAISDLDRQPESSSSRSPRPVLSGKGVGRERRRSNSQHEGDMVSAGRNQFSRINSHDINTEISAEEEFLNMTYEEYLQQHGNQRKYKHYHQGMNSSTSYQSGDFYVADYRSNGIGGMAHSDDQYSNYLANWYSTQGLMMPNAAYHTSQALAKPFPGSQAR